MYTDDETEITDVLSDLSGVRFQIYCLLLREGKAIGVREVQRALNLKSPSHASYHLQKLVELNIADKTPQNAYLLLPEYEIKSIRLRALTDFYLFRGRFIPRSVFFVMYLIMSLVLGLFWVLIDQITILSIYLGLSIIIAIIVEIIEIRKQMTSINEV